MSDYFLSPGWTAPKKTNMVEAIRFLLAVVRLGARKWLKRRDVIMVSQNFASWNQIAGWLKHIDALRRAAA